MMDCDELIEVLDCIPCYEDLRHSYICHLQLAIKGFQKHENVLQLKDEYVQNRMKEINELIKDIEIHCDDDREDYDSDKESKVSDIQTNEAHFESEANTKVRRADGSGSLRTMSNPADQTEMTHEVVVGIHRSPTNIETKSLIIDVPWYSPNHRPILASPTSNSLLEEIQSPLSPSSYQELNSVNSSSWSAQSPLIRFARNHAKKRDSISNSLITLNSGQTGEEELTKSQISSESSIPLLNSNPVVYDEIFWEFRYQSSCSSSYSSITHSKLFFFLSSLWRITFGPDPADPTYYCIYLSPGEQFRDDAYLQVAFHVLSCNSTPDKSPTGNDLPPFSVLPERVYHYPRGQFVSFGYDHFIHRNLLLPYVSPRGTLRLCLDIQAFEPLQG